MKRIIIATAAIIAAIAGLALAAPFLATHLIVERPLLHADAILVLSGSSVYNERATRAAELYKQGVSRQIFLTDDGVRSGWSEAEMTNLSYVELARRAIVADGVPIEAVTILPGRAEGTESEARLLAAEIERRPLASVLIVTSAYHSRRAIWTFDNAFAGKEVTLGIEHAPLGDLNPRPSNWWLSRLGWRLVGSEYVKAVGYWLFY